MSSSAIADAFDRMTGSTDRGPATTAWSILDRDVMYVAVAPNEARELTLIAGEEGTIIDTVGVRPAG